jgi:hypothetical protein
MKALEYYGLYESRLTDLNHKEREIAAGELYVAFAKECLEIANARHAMKTESIRSILKEQGRKWDALCGIFDKNLGSSPIRRGGFYTAFCKEVGITL